MTSQQIRALGPKLARFLDEFDDCFAHADTRGHLAHYVRGQLSDLPRKSVAPMADQAGVPPRTLQEFLSLSAWDEDRLRDTLQRVVARDHADRRAIAVIDESGHPKKGSKTACVQRQYCGNTGKIDNCVMTVHLAYASYDNAFRTMLDSELYLPEQTWADPARRREAEIPDDVAYRSKYEIALAQLRRALDNGVTFGWVTADEWYGEKPAFIAGLEELKLSFVLEMPRNLMGWLHEPADAGESRSTLENLGRHSRVMTGQPWTRYHVKDTQKGPMVWEARAARFWTRRDGRVVGPYRLMVARDVLDPDEVKYFLSDAVDATPATTLHVGFSRWPVERCLQDEKTELGLSHFECRKWPAVRRHLLITQVSHLFLARQTARLRGGKSGGDDLPGAHGLRRAAGRAGPVERGRPDGTDRAGRGADPPDAAAERRGAALAYQGPPDPAQGAGHRRLEAHVLSFAVTQVAL